MTLTRPAYAVTVENVTAGWSYTATQDDDSHIGDAVQLLDDLTLSWSYRDGHAANQMAPEEATFRLLAGTAALLPSADIGDVIEVELVRPTLTTPITYMSFLGRLTDADISPSTRGPVLAIAATGLVSSSPLIKDSGGVWAASPGPQDSPGRIGRIAELATLNMIDPAPPGDFDYQFDLGAVEIDARPAVEVATEVLQSIQPFFGHVLRGFRGTPGFIWDAKGISYQYAPDDLWFLPQEILPSENTLTSHGNAPFQLISDAGTLRLTFTGVDPTDPRQLSACLIELSSTTWSKDRAAAINSILYQGTDDASAVVAYTDLVDKYGENQRTVTTQVSGFGTAGFRKGSDDQTRYPFAKLPDYDDALSRYRVDTLTVLTRAMTDAELDLYAGQFWPVIDADTPTQWVSRLYVVDLDDRFLLSGLALVGAVTGCAFRVAGGQLTIHPTIQTTTPDPDTIDDAVTWAQIAATFPAATWNDIDPTITWAELALASI